MRCFSDGPLANTEWILLPRPMLAWGKEGGRGSLISPANIRDAYRIFNFALFRFTLKKFKTPLRDKQDFFLTWGKEGGHCSLISPANIQDAYRRSCWKIDFEENRWCFVDFRHWRSFSIVFNFNSLWVHYEKEEILFEEYWWLLVWAIEERHAWYLCPRFSQFPRF